MQSLEDRTLLAGDVRVILSGGDVTLMGDDGDNAISLERRNQWIIARGLDGTTLNGMNEFLISGRPFLRDDLIVNLGEGNNALIVNPGVGIGDDVLVETGTGNDLISFSNVTIGDDLIIRTGAGDDTILIRDTDIGDDQGIFAGPGNNTVSVADTRIRDSLVLHTSNGNDVVTVLGTTPGRGHSVETFGGNDTETVLPFNDGRTLPGTDVLRLFIDPVAVDDAYTAVNSALVIDTANGLAANDIRSGFPGTTTITVESDPTNGTLSLNADGSFTYTPDAGFVGTDTFEYRLTNSLGGFDIATVTITRPEAILMLDDLSTNDGVEQSNGILVTETETFTVSGTSNPFAIVDIDSDGDGQFDDGMTIADANGQFSVDVLLVHNDTNMGVNDLQVRAAERLESTVSVHYAIGTVTRFQSSQGNFDVELFDAAAPNTVANFRNYFERYVNSIIHRSVSNFVIQGGGFEFDGMADTQIDAVMKDDPIDNEFDSSNSNVRGTLSMAQLGNDINSGTSEWFFNLVDNTFLDDVPHTVFGRVIGNGMEIVDAIAALDVFNLNGVFPETALGTVPLDNYTPFTEQITGTVSVNMNSNIVTGVGTSFTTELQPSIGSAPGSAIRIGGEEFVVGSIISDTQLTLLDPNSANQKPHSTGTQNVAAFVNAAPVEANYALFTSIDELFDT
ncbi:MAG: hypothetical protein Tsb009_23620 [Planctomycetaceae bacterium]